MPKNNRICGNCKHWQESYNPNADTGICQLTHDCFTGRGYSCPEWKSRECKRCTDCIHFVSNFAWCTLGNHPAYKCGIGDCANWQSKERQQMTVTKKMYDKRCGNCSRWDRLTNECMYLSYHPVHYMQDKTCTPRDFSCNKWQAKEKPKSKNTTIGIDLELNGVDEFKNGLDSIENKVKEFMDRFGNALEAFNDAFE